MFALLRFVIHRVKRRNRQKVTRKDESSRMHGSIGSPGSSRIWSGSVCWKYDALINSQSGRRNGSHSSTRFVTTISSKPCAPNGNQDRRSVRARM